MAPNPLQHSLHTRLRWVHLERLLSPSAGQSFLDVAFGLGFFLERMAGRCRLYGIERDPHATALVHRRLSAHRPGLCCADARRLPFREGVFDWVLCSEVLEHLPSGEDQGLLDQIQRLLAPGGRLVLTAPSLEGLRSRASLRRLGHQDKGGGEYHYRDGYRREELLSMVARAGLEAEGATYAMCLLSELLMDLQKYVYYRKAGGFREQADLAGMKESGLFRVYRLVFPLLLAFSRLEDFLLGPWLKGHILILHARKPVRSEAQGAAAEGEN